MYNNNDIYIKFRQAQSRFYNRPYKIPKKLDEHIIKMNQVNFKNLEKLTQHFNTCYHNIDPDRYFDCGFQLYAKRFSYNKFFDEKILKLYIIKDKNTKRDARLSKKNIINSLKFVVKWIGDRRNKKISLLTQYVSMVDDNVSAPIRHYTMLKIDKYFFVWLIKEGFLKLNDTHKIDIPIIVDNYRNLSYDLAIIDDFLNDVKIKIQEL
jgi:uncharacterized protein YhbP (UPF0306 family)